MVKKKEMGKNNQPNNKGDIKIVDPKSIDYTYTNKDNLFDTKSSSVNREYSDGPKKSKTDKDTQQLRYTLTKNTKIRTRGRITGGQSKQGHSSVYE